MRGTAMLMNRSRNSYIRAPRPDVQHDLDELRDLVLVLEAELLHELGPHPLLVVVEQPGPRRGLGRGRRRALGLGRAWPSLGGLLRLLGLGLLGARRRRRGGRVGALRLLTSGRRPGVSRPSDLRFPLFGVRHSLISPGGSAGRT